MQFSLVKNAAFMQRPPFIWLFCDKVVSKNAIHAQKVWVRGL